MFSGLKQTIRIESLVQFELQFQPTFVSNHIRPCALTIIKQWNPSFCPQVTIHCYNDSCPSAYPYGSTHGMYDHASDSFPKVNLLLDHNLMGSIWHICYIDTGCKTHNTLYTYFIRCHYRLVPGCMTGSPVD